MAAGVECRALAVTFPSRAVPALDGIDISLAPGSWTLLAGRSGSGKSTLLHAIAGLLDRATMQGEVVIAGQQPQRLPAAQRAALVSLVRQSPDAQICTTTVETEIAFGLENLALDVGEIDARITQALALVSLHDLRQRRVTELSGGQRQRLVLAAILAMRPSVLLLDEPLSQLDPAAAREFLAALDHIRAHGPTIIVAEHRIAPWLARVDRLVVLNSGRTSVDLDRADQADWSEALAELAIPAGPTQDNIPAVGERIVRVSDVSFTFDRRRANAVEDASLEIHAGERIALLGLNGSGKSTLLAILARIHAPQLGRIEFSQGDSLVGFVPQNPDSLLFCRTVREELAFAPAARRLTPSEIHRRVQESAQRFHLTEMLGRPALLLSQGERLRVAVAAAWTLQPELLLLDEPTTGQDPWHENELMRALTDERDRAAIVFSTHDLGLAERFADRVIVMDAGRIIADGAPASAITEYQGRIGASRTGAAP